MQSAKNQTTTRISAVNKAKKNKQTNKDDRKQTEAASPFSFPAQLRANRHVQDPNQNRPNFNLFFSLTRRSGLPHILSTPCPLVSPPVNIGLKHLILCAQKAASAFSTLLYSCQSPIVACDCTLCIIRDTLFPGIVRYGRIRPKSQARRPKLPPQQIRTLKKCPFVLLHHFSSTTITHSFLSSVNLTLLLFLQCNNFFIFCLVSLQQGANVKEKGILNYFLRSWSADVLSCSAGLLLVSFRFDSKLDSVGKKPSCYSQPNAGIKENVW